VSLILLICMKEYTYFLLLVSYMKRIKDTFSALCVVKLTPKMGAIYPVASNFFLGVNWRGIKATN